MLKSSYNIYRSLYLYSPRRQPDSDHRPVPPGQWTPCGAHSHHFPSRPRSTPDLVYRLAYIHHSVKLV